MFIRVINNYMASKHIHRGINYEQQKSKEHGSHHLGGSEKTEDMMEKMFL